MIKPLTKLIGALSSNTRPGAIAHAVSCGILLGFLPKNNLLWYVLFVFILFMNIQRGAYALCILLGSALTVFLDPVFDSVGYSVLTAEGMRSAYAALLNIPFVAFTKFNNTVVMGAFVCGIIAYVPFYFLGRLFVWLWRKFFAEKVRKLKITAVLKNLPLIQKIVEMIGE
ncbi:MAG: TIGR03546 family protein [Treponema sp.]|nr:TIGR03546 family protein [Spirochaetia bacterium]MDD7459716.1 TIGR03546 family protein [Spirochaetales bacterium]MDY5811708.1 TIGR03546 family protein [Treponema sp.]MEE1181920.1 TIGR03546 family protein [Treponema sp.]